MSPAQLDELNRQLQILALRAQHYPLLSQERQSALRQIVTGIMRSGRLCRPQKGKFLGTYEDIYAEALQELLLYICKNIDKYDPERAKVMTWVNMLLERRFFKEAIPKVLDSPNRVNMPDPGDIPAPQKTTALVDILKELVETDPENLFKSAHIKNHPDATFQAFLLRRLAEQSWDAIATEFGISVSTASNFYYRCLTKFLPKLKEYCTDGSD